MLYHSPHSAQNSGNTSKERENNILAILKIHDWSFTEIIESVGLLPAGISKGIHINKVKLSV
jgi:hypothetical protein